jgi:uncharacterized damage-inducible protein DinB
VDTAVQALRELTRYFEGETARWREWLAQQDPAVLAAKVGEPPVDTVGALMAHIAGVELVYADALAETPPRAYEWPPTDSLDAIFAVHDEAFAKLVAFLESADGAALERVHTLRVPGWRLDAPAGKMVAHLLVHGIRHWAQVATALRRAGHPQPWPHDLIMGDGFGPAASFGKAVDEGTGTPAGE